MTTTPTVRGAGGGRVPRLGGPPPTCPLPESNGVLGDFTPVRCRLRQEGQGGPAVLPRCRRPLASPVLGTPGVPEGPYAVAPCAFTTVVVPHQHAARGVPPGRTSLAARPPPACYPDLQGVSPWARRPGPVSSGRHVTQPRLHAGSRRQLGTTVVVPLAAWTAGVSNPARAGCQPAPHTGDVRPMRRAPGSRTPRFLLPKQARSPRRSCPIAPAAPTLARSPGRASFSCHPLWTYQRGADRSRVRGFAHG